MIKMDGAPFARHAESRGDPKMERGDAKAPYYDERKRMKYDDRPYRDNHPRKFD